MSDYDLHLYSFDICPFVERSRIVLEEKGVDYESTDIDLSDKPDWFLEISPRGKVPVLQIDGESIFESSVINELLEELFPEPRMLPEDPIQRARARSWIEFNNDEVMGPLAKLYYGRDDAEEWKEKARKSLEIVERQLERSEGRYFLGDTFSLVDAVYAPVFNRWPAAQEYGYGDLLDGLGRVQSYANTLVEHPSVQAGRDDQLLDKILNR